MSDPLNDATRTIEQLHRIATELRMPHSVLSKMTAVHTVIWQIRQQEARNDGKES